MTVFPIRSSARFAVAAAVLAGCVIESSEETRRRKQAESAAVATPAVAAESVAVVPPLLPAPAAAPAPQAAPAAVPESAAAGGVAARADSQPADTQRVDTRRADTLRVDTAGVRVEVDLAARQLTVLRGAERAARYRVAVGTAEWPTRPGTWTIRQVVFNPEWVPPDESWAEQRERRLPGDPRNPLGSAQLVYDPPRTIHGTDDPATIGRAASHGSIRMTNADVVRLARALMTEAGAARDEAWFRRAAEQRTVKQVVDLPKAVPLRVF